MTGFMKSKVITEYITLKLRPKGPTYLFYFHRLEISRREAIVSYALVNAKILIKAHLYSHCAFLSCVAV